MAQILQFPQKAAEYYSVMPVWPVYVTHESIAWVRGYGTMRYECNRTYLMPETAIRFIVQNGRGRMVETTINTNKL